MLYTDIPTPAEFAALDAVRGEICVSLYLPTTPVTRATKANRIQFRNLVAEAVAQLTNAKANKRQISAIEALLLELDEDDRFWAYLSEGLAVFATPKELKTFRIPLSPAAETQVSDRFHIKPLVPLLASQGTCFVLALSQGAVRFVQVTPGLAETIKVPALPKTMSDALKRQLPRDRAPARRIQGGEGMKVLMGQYCRIVDRALRPILAGQQAPLILASVDEIAAIYRANNSYPNLARATIKGNSEKLSDRELAEQARAIAKRRERQIITDRMKVVKAGLSKDLSSTDLAQIAHAAARGQLQTLLVDTTASVPGSIDQRTGKLKLARRASAASYDVLDELVGLAIRNGGEVLPGSSKTIGNTSPVAGIFRYRA